MARLPRLALAGHLHLLIQRGHNGQPVFRDPDDFAAYVGELRDAAPRHGVAVHAYALTETEVLLLATPSEAAGPGAMMQAVSRRFVPGYNRRHGRRGALWEGRFASTVVDAAAHGLACLRLVEQAPLDAGLVAAAADHRWSSAAHHAGQLASPWISDHPLFWGLGNTPFEREAQWRRLLVEPLPVQDRNLLRQAALRGWLLGDKAFEQALAVETSRRLSPLGRGRPTTASKIKAVIGPSPIYEDGRGDASKMVSDPF